MFNFNIQEDIEAQFDQIAQQLFHHTQLVVNDKTYSLTEIEFYVHQEDRHPDPFVHENALQLTSNQWYFHGSGVDITIGDEATKTYGGILLRGLKEITSEGQDKYYDGPLNILRELFRHFHLSACTQNFGLKTSEPIPNDIYKSIRIGLNPKNKEQGEVYAMKKYRYLIDLSVTAHKYKAKGKVLEFKVLVKSV